jgi:hypothetical protein
MLLNKCLPPPRSAGEVFRLSQRDAKLRVALGRIRAVGKALEIGRQRLNGRLWLLKSQLRRAAGGEESRLHILWSGACINSVERGECFAILFGSQLSEQERVLQTRFWLRCLF